MEDRVTIKDIARKVGVSPMTVSKALNEKPQVSDTMKKLILKTAKEMNYIPNVAAKRLSQKERHIAAIYPREPQEFYSNVEQGIQKAEADLVDSKCKIFYYSYSSLNSVGEVSACIEQALDNNIDGLILTGNHNFNDYKEALGKVTSKHIPVLYNTICGERIPGIIGAVRLNSELAGKIAADFHSFCDVKAEKKVKKVAIFVGNKSVSVHMDCVQGYMENAKQYGIEVVGVYETNEDRELSYSITGEVLEQFPDLYGIYISSYNAVGVCDWLLDHHLEDKVVVIGHDLYPELAKRMNLGALKATIFQNQFEFGYESVIVMSEYLNGLRNEAQCEKIKTAQLVTKSMLPYFKHYVEE